MDYKTLLQLRDSRKKKQYFLKNKIRILCFFYHLGSAYHTLPKLRSIIESVMTVDFFLLLKIDKNMGLKEVKIRKA